MTSTGRRVAPRVLGRPRHLNRHSLNNGRAEYSEICLHDRLHSSASQANRASGVLGLDATKPSHQLYPPWPRHSDHRVACITSHEVLTAEGHPMIYAAQFETMNALLIFLTKNCCGGAAPSCGTASRS